MGIPDKLPPTVIQQPFVRDTVLPFLVRAKRRVHQATAPRPHPEQVEEPPPGPAWLHRILSLPGMIGERQVTTLHELAKSVRNGVIVEVGSYRGKSASALGQGSWHGHRVPVYAIDPHEPFRGIFGGNFGPQDRKAFYNSMLKTGCWEMVRLINLSSEVVSPGWDKPIGLLWIDGDHTYEGVKRDFECWEPHLLPEARVAFDDAVQEDGGPFKLISELLATGTWRKLEEFGKMAVLERKGLERT